MEPPSPIASTIDDARYLTTTLLCTGSTSRLRKYPVVQGQQHCFKIATVKSLYMHQLFSSQTMVVGNHLQPEYHIVAEQEPQNMAACFFFYHCTHANGK